MLVRHFSIATNTGRQTSTIPTDSSAVRREDSLTKLIAHGFDIRAARIFWKVASPDALVSNVFAVFDLARYTISGNRLSCDEKSSGRQTFAREDFAGTDSSTRVQKPIQFDDCRTNCANSRAPDKILPGDAAKVFKYNSSNLVTTGTVSELTTPSATIIDPDTFIAQCSPRPPTPLARGSSYGADEIKSAKIEPARINE
jgi:hypothetical protein